MFALALALSVAIRVMARARANIGGKTWGKWGQGQKRGQNHKLLECLYHTPEMLTTQPYTVVSLFASCLEISRLRIKIKSQDQGIRKEAQGFKGSRFRHT